MSKHDTIIFYGEGKRFQVTSHDGGYNEAIYDTRSGTRLFLLATTGMGTPSSTMTLAERVVDFLNKHYNDVKLYPER